MKVKESKIAFISFYSLFRIETFQWVIGNKRKKIWLGLDSRGGLCSGVFPSFPRPRSAGGAASCPVNMKYIAHWSDYRKKIHAGLPFRDLQRQRLNRDALSYRPAPTADADACCLGQSATSRDHRNLGIPTPLPWCAFRASTSNFCRRWQKVAGDAQDWLAHIGQGDEVTWHGGRIFGTNREHKVCRHASAKVSKALQLAFPSLRPVPVPRCHFHTGKSPLSRLSALSGRSYRGPISGKML